jgi:hypothetical protein
MYPLLEAINDPAALRKLERASLKQLARELRAFLLESVVANGWPPFFESGHRRADGRAPLRIQYAL